MTPDQCAEGIVRHAVSEHSHRVMQGFFLLKARAAYALPAADRGQGRKSLAPVATDAAEQPAGFLQWMAETIVQPRILSERTAYNYMTAATNCGLTPDMTEAAAEAMAREKMADIASIAALYKLPSSGKLEGPPAPPPEPEPAAVWGGFTATLADYFSPQCEAMRALPRLPVPALEGLLSSVEAARDNIREILTRKKGARA